MVEFCCNSNFTCFLQAAAPAEGIKVRGGGGAVGEANPHAAGQGGEQGPGPCQRPQHQLGGGELSLIEYLFCVTIDNCTFERPE